MNIRRMHITFVLRAILVTAAFVCSAPLIAQTTILSSTTTSTSTLSTATATTTTALVPLSGIVSGMPESVKFSGQAQVSARVVTDPTFGSWPTVVLNIDLSNVTGVGSSTGKNYGTSNREILTRTLSAADTVQVTVPFQQSGGVAALVGMASFNLSFDVNTLKLTAASGSIGSP
jgi:hypothetical protein